MSAALPGTAAPRVISKDLWLVSRGYDLVFIIFSSALLVVPHLFAQLGGLSNVIVDLVVTAFIGGPHLFATYTMTFMEPRFRERYRRYTWGALLMPVLVVSLAIYNLTLLVTIFFLWASVHVIHQAAYIADAYRFKDPRGRTPNLARWQLWSRIIDYGLLMTSLYPIATFKFTGAPLVIGGIDLTSEGFETGGRSCSRSSSRSSGSGRSRPGPSSPFCSPSSPRRSGNGRPACCTSRRRCT